MAAPSYHTGYGGSITLQGGSNPVLNIGSWEFTKERGRSEVTNSGSAGWKTRVPTVRDSKGKFELPWDSGATPESVGYDIGAAVTLKMTLGDSGVAYTVPALIADVGFKSDSKTGEAIMVVVTWEGNGPMTGPA